MYLALDPGKTTGWAAFEDNGDAIKYGQYNEDECYDFLLEAKPKLYIVEGFELFPWKAQKMAFDDLPAAQMIGAIRLAAKMHGGIPIELQPSSVLSVAYKWAGIQKPKNHAISHGPDAYAHGVYYLQKNGIRKPQQGRAT